jgi:hypothetical protein
MALRRQGLALFLLATFALGCSKGDAPVSAGDSTGAKTAGHASGSSADSSVAAEQVEAPAAVVTRFLDALRRGEKETVASLLTSAARAETVRLGYEINPPGDPASKYEVGRVEIVPGPPEEAYVSSLWTHDLGNSELFTYEAVWIARREPEGWRISGLAVSEPESDAPLVFNFEQLEEVFEKKNQVEQTEGVGESARQAQNPRATEGAPSSLQ